MKMTGGIKGGRIKIGQGFRGKTEKGIGSGDCTAGYERYVKGCPPRANEIAAMIDLRFSIARFAETIKFNRGYVVQGG